MAGNNDKGRGRSCTEHAGSSITQSIGRCWAATSRADSKQMGGGRGCFKAAFLFLFSCGEDGYLGFSGMGCVTVLSIKISWEGIISSRSAFCFYGPGAISETV